MSNDLIPASHLPTSQDDINQYLKGIRHIPILTKEEEIKLTTELHVNQSLEAARQLVLHHLRFVVYIAKNYRGYGLPLPDLIQEGNVGLMKAVKNFNPDKGVRLASFAVHWIKSEINEYIIKNWKIVKVATTKEQRKLFFNLRSQKKDFNWLTQDEAKKIAKDLNVSKEQVFEMESRLSNQDVTFDAPDNDEDSKALVPSQYLVADEMSDPAKQHEYQDYQDKSKKALHIALTTLDERSRDILQRRWLNDSDDKPTLHDLAAEYSISAERVRQIENIAMKKLKSLIVY